MHRECSHCHRSFTAKDLIKKESKGMESDRKVLGLQGVRFLYYSCLACGYDEIFVDLHPLPGESLEELRHRRQELEATVREFHGEKVDAVICERS